uniref:Peptidase M16 n=1 Tax=Thermogemmatispora argillosa TaxID=2045280 RepID=A0A455T3J0_9CHLR|nr:peptidase M16 [Thermogemmatispora argillosa]
MDSQQDLQLPPDFFYHRLPNGLEVIGQYMPSLRSVTFGFQLDAAVIHEPEDKSGLAHLFEYMLFQGTREKDARTLNEAFESLGARKGTSTTLETTQVWAQIVNTKLDATLDLFHEVLLMPTFPRDELEQMRNIILQEIRRRDDEPMSRIFDLARAHFYAGSALGRQIYGTAESVRALRQEDLVSFWQDRYRPNNALLSIAGNFDWDQVVAKVERLFGDWQGAASPSPEQHPRPSNTVVLEHQEGKQEHLGLMVPFPNYTHPDYYAAQIISEALGGNMASRLFVEVREKRGLVYSVSAGLSSNKAIGALRIYAGTTPEQGHECLAVILNELQRLREEGLTEDELERARVQLKSEHIMRSEGSGARMSANARSWWYERRLRTPHEVKEAIDAVTAEQIMRVLREFSPLEPLTVAAIGPLSRDELVGNLLPFA